LEILYFDRIIANLNLKIQVLKGRTSSTLDGRTINELLIYQAQVREKVLEKIKKAAQKMIKRRMKKYKAAIFEVGDQVFVRKKKKEKNEPLYKYEGKIVRFSKNYTICA